MILAFGCSITHGAELVHPYQSQANIEFSYPSIMARSLNLECSNYAICGNSNENIFHNLISTIKNFNTQTDRRRIIVVVGWTSWVREQWHADGREWFIIPSWAATTKNLSEPFKHYKDYTDEDVNTHPRLCTDDTAYYEPLQQVYDVITRYKFDNVEYLTKSLNYIETVRSFCGDRGIKLIETGSMGIAEYTNIPVNIDNFGTWRTGRGHPTRVDHEQIAQHILLRL